MDSYGNTEMHKMKSPKSRLQLYSSQKSTVSLEIPLKADVDDYESWSHQYDDIIDELKDWCSAQENLDVYQMNSFYAGINNVRAQVINYYKTAMVFFIQTAGAIFLAYNQLTVGFAPDSKICDLHDFGWLAFMAFSFTGFISLTLNDQLAEISRQGVYRFKRNLPPFFNKFWLSTGIFINIFVLMVSWIVSIVVIFLATNPLDMILNSIAVYFLIELDDMMVNRVDYEFVEVWLKDEFDMWMRAKFEARKNVGYERSGIDKIGQCILRCASVTEVGCVKWVIRIFATVMPVVVLVCFNQSFEGVDQF